MPPTCTTPSKRAITAGFKRHIHGPEISEIHYLHQRVGFGRIRLDAPVRTRRSYAVQGISVRSVTRERYCRIYSFGNIGFVNLLAMSKTMFWSALANIKDVARFSGPRSARRVPQPCRGQLSEHVFEPEARCSAPGEFASARWGEERKGLSRAPGCPSLW